MYILEIFLKKRKYAQIFDKTWKEIGDCLAVVQKADASTDPKLELFFFISMVYCTVQHAALAAGMSNSSAHYLARIQSKKYRVETPIVMAAQDLFAAPEQATLINLAESLNRFVQPIVANLARKNFADSGLDTETSMRELHQLLHQCNPAELLPEQVS